LYCLHILYKRSRHYNPILNLKAAAGSRERYCVSCNMAIEMIEIVVRKNAHVVMPHRHANGLMRISLGAKRVIACSSKISALSVIMQKDLMIKNLSQVFTNQLEFATVADDS